MARTTLNSQAAFAKAQEVMPGGVSSPVRAFKAVGGTPIFIKEGEGCRVVDIDGNSYVDFVASYGPLIAGHANERVVAALSKQIGRGSSFGAPTELETQLATIVITAVPSAQMVRFVNSGTEACMSALRLARAATGREKIVKCIGCYHGHTDSLLVSAGSGALTLGTPSSPGVPSSVASTTILVHFNDLEGTEAAFKKDGAGIAALEILQEPSVYQMLDERTAALAEGLAETAAEANVPLTINRAGSMITPFFVRKHGLAVNNYDGACACDTAAYAKFFQVML